ncbi:dTDP-4-dehydrorhamnose 3,5-epimerase family protein [Candidatus Uhrbacteria bacterium]|nr:dTDP-4-dehydrorhamnose 3,5-epimerase family protein [Candidatus Uhrbacteria bacterium]
MEVITPIADARVETTAIVGLELHHTKVVGDARGLLAELVQGGTANPVLAPGLGNLYVSIAVGKHVGRAAHFHFRLRELFFTITGTAVWFFHDFRSESPTAGQSFVVVLGAERPAMPTADPVYVLADRDMVRVDVPPGVYHAYWPLTDTPVAVLAAPSLPHDDTDYDRRKPSEIPGCRELLARYQIVIS